MSTLQSQNFELNREVCRSQAAQIAMADQIQDLERAKLMLERELSKSKEKSIEHEQAETHVLLALQQLQNELDNADAENSRLWSKLKEEKTLNKGSMITLIVLDSQAKAQESIADLNARMTSFKQQKPQIVSNEHAHELSDENDNLYAQNIKLIKDYNDIERAYQEMCDLYLQQQVMERHDSSIHTTFPSLAQEISAVSNSTSSAQSFKKVVCKLLENTNLELDNALNQDSKLDVLEHSFELLKEVTHHNENGYKHSETRVVYSTGNRLLKPLVFSFVGGWIASLISIIWSI